MWRFLAGDQNRRETVGVPVDNIAVHKKPVMKWINKRVSERFVSPILGHLVNGGTET